MKLSKTKITRVVAGATLVTAAQGAPTTLLKIITVY